MVKRLLQPAFLRFGGNLASILTSDVLNRATTFVLYALVGRSLDARAFGQISLALALLYTFQVFAVMGMPNLITRQVAKDPSGAGGLLTGGILLALFGSSASIGALAIFVALMRYEADTASIILTLSAALVPYALSSVFEAMFRGWQRMHLIALSNVPVNLAKVVVAYVLLERGFGVPAVVMALVGCRAAIAVIQAGFILCGPCRPALTVAPSQVWDLARGSGAFFAIDGLLAVWASLSVVLLSAFGNERDVGLFNAAAQLLTPFTLFSQAVMVAAYPLLCRKFEAAGGRGGLTRMANALIGVLLAASLPAAIALFCLAEPLLLLIYGKQEFAHGATVLRIMSAVVALRALTAGLGQILLAGGQEKVTLRIVLIDVIAAIALGVPLISQYGVIGAAVAAILARLIDCCQHYAPVTRLLPRFELASLAWMPVAASLAMALPLLGLRSLNVALVAAAGAAVYAAVLAGLFLLTGEGARRLEPRRAEDGEMKAA